MKCIRLVLLCGSFLLQGDAAQCPVASFLERAESVEKSFDCFLQKNFVRENEYKG